MANTKTTNIEVSSTNLETLLERLDSARLGGFHLRLLLVSGTCWLFAALGMTIVGFILPALRQEWGLSSSQAGLVASSGVLGMMVGAVLAGSLADRVGRRSTLALVIAWLGISSALSSLASSYLMLLLLRALTGFGIGAVLPVASTLVSEYSPARYRGRLQVLLDGSSGFGMGLAALIGYGLVDSFGWRLGLLCTSLSAACAPLVFLLIPESLRFLLSKQRFTQAQETARRIRLNQDDLAIRLPRNPATESPSDPLERQASGAAGAWPWSASYIRRTASLWLLWFSLNFTSQGIFVWMPSLLRVGGNSPAQSDLFFLVISLGQVPGTIIAVLFVDRVNRRLTLALAMILWSAAVFIFGFSADPFGVLLWGFMLATGNAVVWGMAYPFTTELYPTRMRGSATGWATGFGRTGGILAPWAVGLLIQSGAHNPTIFSFLAAAPILTTLVLLGLRQQTTGRALEEISR